MDVGMGVHGEAGLSRRELGPPTTLRTSCSSSSSASSSPYLASPSGCS